MMPQGTPAYSCSARWQSLANSNGAIAWPVMAASNVAVATSKAALLDSPPPSGTVESITASNAGTHTPRAENPATTPRT